MALKCTLLAALFLLQSCKIAQKPFLYDNFSSPNYQIWETSNHTFSNNLARFSPANATYKNQALILSLTNQSNGDKNLTAAEIKTKKHFRYGKFVCSMKPASGSGVISGFFLYNGKGKEPEIDIELVGKNPRQVTLSYWENGKGIHKTVPLGFDASQDFHEYAITWLPGRVSWEVDGKKSYSVKGQTPSKPMQLLMNIWASKPNDWAGYLDSATLPKQTEWKYVKIFKRVF